MSYMYHRCYFGQLQVHCVINQSVKSLWRQYPQRSQAHWRNSQIGVQIPSHRGYSVTSTGHWAHRCLPGEGQLEKISFETSFEGGNGDG